MWKKQVLCKCPRKGQSPHDPVFMGFSLGSLAPPPPNLGSPFLFLMNSISMSVFVSLVHCSVMVGHTNLHTSAGALGHKSCTQPKCTPINGISLNSWSVLQGGVTGKNCVNSPPGRHVLPLTGTKISGLPFPEAQAPGGPSFQQSDSRK